jgi:hypothetical protein
MLKYHKYWMSLFLSVLLAGCATAPAGPHVSVMPAKGKTLEQFKVDDQICKDYAQAQIGDARPSGITPKVPWRVLVSVWRWAWRPARIKQIKPARMPRFGMTMPIRNVCTSKGMARAKP